ncbi:hypothetical protein BV25DRAFT_1825795 [Artomyces pyxidatus]|uniref:Uncharacterized protein n=1 Tax=Artomyces pyxidatus TaxID=48021 RepID=A0ACB8T1K2_9AGAM|nr:hypothetical protein BV25DRAFT_1825795 [Artomyces pyxidatus]
MPERKSSLGTSRRAAQKAHIPFRADDLQRGKKTGVSVGYVDHKSDEFEPFGQILSQADTRTPPRARNGTQKGKRKSEAFLPTIDDEDGEMSMELDQSPLGGPTSATAYYHSTRQNAQPSSVSRVGSSSRPVARGSDVDYDAVPSPPARSSIADRSRRSSVYNGGTAGPSRLSHSVVAHDEDEDMPFDDGGGEDHYQDEGDYRRQSFAGATPRRTSFTQIGRDESVEDENLPGGEEDEDEDEEDAQARAEHSRAKGKGRALDQDDGDDQEVEEEIAQGMQEVDNDYPEDEDDEEPEPERPEKRKRASSVEEGVQKKPRGRPKKTNLPPSQSPEHPENTDGRRRGTRLRYKPLEYWRQEKVVWGRRESGISYVPTIKKILRLPKEEPKPLGIAGKRSKRKTAPRSKSATEQEVVTVYNPEEGWDDETLPNGNVIDFLTGREVARRLVWPSKLIRHRESPNKEFYFTKIFGDGEYIAAGQLKIPARGHKPSKSTKDNTYVFYVIEGAVTFKIHETSYVLCTGATILVPRGNTYYIENIAERDAKLFFTQARRVSAEEETPTEVLPASAAPPQRSTSLGQAPRQSSELPTRRGASKA